jgi:acyl-CoA thioesterase FadM
MEIETRVEALGTSPVRFAHTLARLTGDPVARLSVQRVFVGVTDGAIARKPLPDELRIYLTGQDSRAGW